MKAHVSLCNVLGTGILTILPGVYTYPRALDSQLVHITISSKIPIPSCLTITLYNIFAPKVFGKREASLYVDHNPHERGHQTTSAHSFLPRLIHLPGERAHLCSLLSLVHQAPARRKHKTRISSWMTFPLWFLCVHIYPTVSEWKMPEGHHHTSPSFISHSTYILRKFIKY